MKERLILTTSQNFAETLRSFCKEHHVSLQDLFIAAGTAALDVERQPPLASGAIGSRVSEVHVRVDARVKEIFMETFKEDGFESFSRWMESALLHEMRKRLVVAELEAKAQLASVRFALSSLKVEELQRHYDSLVAEQA